MMRRLNKTLFLTTLLCIFPMLISLFFFKELPTSIAIQWDLNGEVTNTVPRWFGIYVLPLLLVLLNIILHATLANDPKQKNVPKVLRGIGHWTMSVISLFIQIIIYITNMGKTFYYGSAVMIFIGFLLILIGNYLPKCKQNYSVGIKLPWTLHDEENWNKTHHLAGFVWIAGGLLLIINAFVTSVIFLVFVFLAVVFIPIIHSLVLYKKKDN